MRKNPLLLLLLFLLPLRTSLAAAGSAADIRQDLLTLMNQERGQAGAPVLRYSEPLERAAQEQAVEIALHGTLDLPANSDNLMQQRLDRAGYAAHAWSETISTTSAAAEGMIRDWKGRDASFRRLLDPAYADVGIGVSQMNGMPLYTILFAEPAAEHFANQTADLRDLARVRAAMLARVNEIRRRQGLSPLRPNPALDRAAQKHAEDMLARAYFSHRSPEGTSVRDRSRLQGYDWRAIGENLAEGQMSVDEVVDGWMKSPGHRENILGPEYSELGIGLALGRSGRSGEYNAVWVQNFGRPR